MRERTARLARLGQAADRSTGVPVLYRPPGTTRIGLEVERLRGSAGDADLVWCLDPYPGSDRPPPADRIEHGSARSSRSLNRSGVRTLFIDDIAGAVRRTVAAAKPAGGTLLIGARSDPYQPAEERFGITRRVLETLAGFDRLVVGLTTASSLIARDLSLLAELSRRHELGVSIIIPALDEQTIARVDRAGPTAAARLAALGQLAAAGIDVGVLIAPIVAGLTDGWGALGGLMAAREAGASYAVGSALRVADVARAGLLPGLDRELSDESSRRRGRPEYAAALDRKVRTLQQIHGFPSIGVAFPARPAAPRADRKPDPPGTLSFDFDVRSA
jgi:DNA repair photolyase